jgi:hypothetical protein
LNAKAGKMHQMGVGRFLADLEAVLRINRKALSTRNIPIMFGKLKEGNLRFMKQSQDSGGKCLCCISGFWVSYLVVDPCVFILKEGNSVIYIGLYVDDLRLAGSDESRVVK